MAPTRASQLRCTIGSAGRAAVAAMSMTPKGRSEVTGSGALNFVLDSQIGLEKECSRAAGVSSS